MLADKIKQKVDELKNEAINKIEKEDAVKIEAQKKELHKLKFAISYIKNNIISLSDGKLNIRLNSSGFIFVGENRHFHYSDDLHYSNRQSVGFFDHFKHSPFSGTLLEFKNWLDANGFKNLFIVNEHDGGGIQSWVSFWVEMK